MDKSFVESNLSYSEKCLKIKEYLNKCTETFTEKKVEYCVGFYNALKSCNNLNNKIKNDLMK